MRRVFAAVLAIASLVSMIGSAAAQQQLQEQQQLQQQVVGSEQANQQSITQNGSPIIPPYPFAPIPTLIPSQPYMPAAFMNGNAPVRPSVLDIETARRCHDGGSFSGEGFIGAKGSPIQEIRLRYLVFEPRDQVKVRDSMAGYVGTITVTTNNGPWLPTICRAAVLAMEGGVEQADVEFVVVPQNNAKGGGVGVSIGTSGLPVNAWGLGTSLSAGWATMKQFTSGYLQVQLTGYRTSAAKSSGVAPAPRPIQQITLSGCSGSDGQNFGPCAAIVSSP